jgi:hypothetical protein
MKAVAGAGGIERRGIASAEEVEEPVEGSASREQLDRYARNGGALSVWGG